MRFLFIGDIFGAPGRSIIQNHLRDYILEHHIDVVIANGENSAHGKGINPNIYQLFLESGVDVITMGNHYLAVKEKTELFDTADKIVRPLNIHPDAPGVGTRVFTKNGVEFRVTNLLGRVMINELSPSSPFSALESVIAENESPIHIIDFHAEATAEKYALAYRFSGAVSAIIGTHTHVQTADERILPGETGYISDAGMTGPYHSVIGCEIESSIYRSEKGLPTKFEVADGPVQFNAVMLDIDPKSGKCLNIRRLQAIHDIE